MRMRISSFKPYVCDKIASREKIFEHRSRKVCGSQNVLFSRRKRAVGLS